MHRDDGNLAALRQYERDNDEADRDMEMIEKAALSGQKFYLNNLDTDDIEEALQGLTKDELESLCEDCGGPMRDGAHAGSIILGAVERYCFQLAVKDEMERTE